jgi:hypothetical protein
VAPSVKPSGSVMGKVFVFLAVGGGLLSTVAYLHRAKHQILARNKAREAAAASALPDAGVETVEAPDASADLRP